MINVIVVLNKLINLYRHHLLLLVILLLIKLDMVEVVLSLGHHISIMILRRLL